MSVGQSVRQNKLSSFFIYIFFIPRTHRWPLGLVYSFFHLNFFAIFFFAGSSPTVFFSPTPRGGRGRPGRPFSYAHGLLIYPSPVTPLQLRLTCLGLSSTLIFLSKNHVYKNVEAQIAKKIRTS